MFQYVRRATDGRHTIVAVLGHFITRSSHHQCGEGGDIEGVFSIPSGSAEIHGFTTIEVDRAAQFQECIPKTVQFFQANGAHQVNSDKGSYLSRRDVFPGNSHEGFPGLFPVQGFMSKELIEYIFHFDFSLRGIQEWDWEEWETG